MSSSVDEIRAAFEAAEDVVFEWSELLEGSEVPLIIPDVDGIIEAIPADIRAGQELREVVVKWTRPDGAERFFRKTGCYTSWDGYTWDGPFEEVFPREVVRTEWVKA